MLACRRCASLFNSCAMMPAQGICRPQLAECRTLLDSRLGRRSDEESTVRVAIRCRGADSGCMQRRQQFGKPDRHLTAATRNTPDSGCNGSCATAQSFLTSSDVQTIIAQAVNEAQAQGKPAVIAVVDRVGNVLGVYRMNGAPVTATITSASRCQWRSGKSRRARRTCGDRQGDHRRLSVLRRQCVLVAHRQPDRAGTFQSGRLRHAVGTVVRRAVFATALLGFLDPIQRRRWRRRGAASLAARPVRRSRRLPLVQSRHAGRRRRCCRGWRLRPRCRSLGQGSQHRRTHRHGRHLSALAHRPIAAPTRSPPAASPCDSAMWPIPTSPARRQPLRPIPR